MVDAPNVLISFVTLPAPVMFWVEEREMTRKANVVPEPTVMPLVVFDPERTSVLVPARTVLPV